MPNLVGIRNPALSADGIRVLLSKQLKRTRIPGIEYQEHLCVHPGFGMALMDHGLLENGNQPARTSNGLPQQAVSVPELCLQLLTLQGEKVLSQFNGLFCILLYDADTRRLTVISDRYGFRPLYWAQRESAFIFGSELKSLCAADPTSRRIDEIGTFELFAYGSHFMERTWLDGYSRIPPATVLTVDDGGIQTRAYWDYKYVEGAPALDQDTYSAVLGTILDRAVERTMQGSKRVGIFLSGGYDSRSVAASIRKHHLPIPAITFGQGDSRDVRYAAMLAERLGLTHTALTDRGPYLYANCRSIVWRTEGMISFANTTSIRYHAVMKKEMDIILTGFLAEFGGSHTWPKLLVSRSRKAAIQAVFDRYPGSRLGISRRLFTPGFFQKASEGMRVRFAKSFDRVYNEHPLNVADCWNLINIQPRTTYHAPSIDRHKFEARAPHMDADLVDFLLTIPPYSRLEQRVYKKMIARQFPAIRDVPCTNSDRPIDPRFALEYTKMVARYAAGKARGTLRRLFRLHEPLGREFRDLNDDFRAEPQLMDQVLRPMLRAGIYPVEIFNHSAIEEIITEHYERNGRHENVLSLLISWGLAAKYFIHEDFSDVPLEMCEP